jgi:hypothetical protein
MTYIIVTRKETVVGNPLASFDAALIQATRLFGDDIEDWLNLNLRIEENR